MISKIKSLLDTDDKKGILSNFFSLSIIQGLNYILPLITLPYLVRVIGLEYFGLLAFATSLVTYFQIFVDYGFNYSATRNVSINKDNNDKLVEIYSSVISIKIIFILISFCLFALIIFNFQKFSNDALIYFLTFGTIIGQTLMPIWFFQGMEKMKYITYLNIISKTIFTFAIFIFVNEKDDFFLVPIFISLGFLIASIYSYYLIKKQFNLYFKFQSTHIIKVYLIDGWYIFLTSFQSIILSSSGSFILGLFANYEIVGIYSSIDKLSRAILGLFSPISQVLYPVISRKLNINKENGIIFIKKISFFILSIFFLIIVIIIIFSKFIVCFIYGDNFIGYEYILQILSIWVFFSILNNFLGIQYLTLLGYSNYYAKSFSFASLCAIVLFIIFIPFAYINGLLIGMIISEVTLSLIMIYYIKRNNL